MNKFILLIVILSLAGCSTPPQVAAMKIMNATPIGISILNVDNSERVEAYRIAEKHCAKYQKVPRLLDSSKQLEKSDIPLSTMVYQCLRPSN